MLVIFCCPGLSEFTRPSANFLSSFQGKGGQAVLVKLTAQDFLEVRKIHTSQFCFPLVPITGRGKGWTNNQKGVLNDGNFLKSYEFNAFSGARFSSALDYTVYLKNKNGIRLSYEWDA